MGKIQIEIKCYDVTEIKKCFSCKESVNVNEPGIDIVLGENITFMCDDCGDVFLRKMLTAYTGINHME
ncbi:MAG: hypothetical protein ACRC41_16140 [Sarcina sp.]